MSKVRIYDLAKELKLESKKILEDARRMGVDVSVPSNTLEDNIAAKIREMYYPKKEQAPAIHRARLIKHQTAPGAPAEQTAAAQAVIEKAQQAPLPAESEPPARPSPPPVPQTTIKPIMPPKPAPGPPATSTTSAPPAPPTPQAQPQASTPATASPSLGTQAPGAEAKPGAEVKPKVIKLAPQPAAEPAQAHEVDIEQAVAPAASAPAPSTPSAPAPVAPPMQPSAHTAQKDQTAQKDKDKQPKPPVEKFEEKRIVSEPRAAEVAPAAKPQAPVTPSKPVGTKVIKLKTPTQPMPKPAAPPKPAPKLPPPKPAPSKPALGKSAGARPAAATAQQARSESHGGEQRRGEREGQREGQRDGRDKAVHLLPSGAQQRTVYIPPKDQRPKGRHQQRHKGEKDKFQEGNAQRLMPRKQIASPVSARAIPEALKSARLVEGSTVREFAEKIEAKPRDIVTALMQRGVMATINQTISPEMARDIGRQYGFDVAFGDYEDMIVESEFEITPEAMEDTDPRAPVITVMGHVDHGKTSLLDAIRETRVAEGEAGGITQHIGAYSVNVPNPDKPSEARRVVFLDTPGHEAFTMMRARGARVTDIVVLVVAADDGVMPQTVEAIDHAKAAKVPIVVAINKVDKPDANPDRVKKELADRGLLWDGWGGETTMVEVSAKMKRNIDGLLEMVLLTADILDMKANPRRKATGTVLEAKLDRGRGSVATVLIQNGTLRIGDPFIAGNFFGKVRALMDDFGQRVQSVSPATPVEVLGLEGVPAAGDQFQVVDDIVKAQQIGQFRQSKARAMALARTAARGLDQLAIQMSTGEVKELLVILKADVQGSVEVLKDTLTKLSTEKVKVRIIRAGVGAITYDDVLLASASNATESGAATVIIGFNVRPEARADDAAKQEDVDIRLHSIIYKVEEEIRNSMLGLMEATTKETVIGKAEVRDVIRVPKVGAVAGCMVTGGSVKRTAHARLIRDNVVVFESNIGSLRRFKDDVSEVQQGYECGVTIERFNDYKVGDVIEAFITEKVAPTKLE
ncbi:MAG: translation initiation factor IF-2 [Chloracidobacterium sp.]|nr:translation initiation factor IF-2 [Chloracidobacterium sp.]